MPGMALNRTAATARRRANEGEGTSFMFVTDVMMLKSVVNSVLCYAQYLACYRCIVHSPNVEALERVGLCFHPVNNRTRVTLTLRKP